MKELIFKSILIADVVKKTAYYQEFFKGFNVITSSNNHVGKSSLLKSLYYALGAETEFDGTWDKNSKIYIVTFTIDNKNFKIIRFLKRFALFNGDDLVLLTDSVSKDLAKKFECLFDFGVYLPNRIDNKVELAPPVFTFMPYYIDQDRGWAEIYDSFSNLEQYKKDARIKSIYYHLGIYDKNTIELFSQKDSLSASLEKLVDEANRLHIVINTLSEELQNIIPAINVENLDSNLALSKEKISSIVNKIGAKRNEIQKLETTLGNHKYQLSVLDVLNHHEVNAPAATSVQNILSCPNCGYIMDKEIFEIVQKNYSSLTKQYARQQILLLIQRLEGKLENAKKEYVELMKQMEKEESVFKESQNAFDTYLAQKGLKTTFNSLSKNYENNISEQAKVNDEIRTIVSQLTKMPNKKEVEAKYIDFTKQNLLALDAWESSYEKQIKLLKPLKGQGTLTNKIILAQIIALFQTMKNLKIESNKFPFVIDSPRGNEASYISSEEILRLIFKIDCLPQIILATIDFSSFKDSIDYAEDINVIELNKQYALLNKECYNEYSSEIEPLHNLLNDMNKIEV